MMILAKQVEEWTDQSDALSENVLGSTNPSSRFSGARVSSVHTRGDQLTGVGAFLSKTRNPNGQDTQTTTFRGSRERAQIIPSKVSKNRKTPYRRLSEEEKSESKAKGLCFRCNERYHGGYQCRMKELQVIVVKQDGNEYKLEDVEEGGGEIAELAELSLNSMVGISSPRTLKLLGSVQ